MNLSIKNVAPVTIKNYRHVWKHFTNWYTGDLTEITASVIAIFLLIGGNSSRTIAEKLLKTYYTVENSDIYNLLITPGKNVEIETALKNKYGDFATNRVIERTTANREILAGEKLASEKNCTISVKKIDLSKGVTTWNRDISYSFVVQIVIKYADDKIKEFTVYGNLLMTKEDGKWKVNVFCLKSGWSMDKDLHNNPCFEFCTVLISLFHVSYYTCFFAFVSHPTGAL